MIKNCFMLCSVLLISIALYAQKTPSVVINEVYGGGGNTGGLFSHDFVELYNNADTDVDISGWSLLYASTSGAWNNTPTTVYTFPPNSIIKAKKFVLVQADQGSNTSLPSLPPADFISALKISGTGGKVALVNNTEIPDVSNTVDLIGWGTANIFEGAPAPKTTNKTSIQRVQKGVDTDNNANDFIVQSPSPANSINTPIKISHFYAQQQQENITVSWIVTLERDVTHYTLYKYTNQQWQAIATILPKGIGSYIYSDNNILDNNIYQLEVTEGPSSYILGKIALQTTQKPIKIFPNPVKTLLQIRVNNGLPAVSNIYTLAGKKIISKPIINHQITLEGLPKGYYLIEIIQKDKIVHTQVILKE